MQKKKTWIHWFVITSYCLENSAGSCNHLLSTERGKLIEIKLSGPYGPSLEIKGI